MRRRVFLNQSFIAESRHFVCVRLNAWQDKRNVERIVRLQGVHQNSCLALVPPDAPGVAVDSFPTAKECAWGPLDFNGSDGSSPWEEVGRHLRSLPDAMRTLAQEHPARPAAGSRPVLPVFPDLTQVLNIAACDCRAVIVAVADESDMAALDHLLVGAIAAPHVVGRAHVVRATPAEWRVALDSGQIVAAPDDATGGAIATDIPGIFVVGPEPYGLHGTLLARIDSAHSPADLLATLHDGLDRFAASFHKLDRSSHIIEGRRDGKRWKEFQPGDWRLFADPSDDAPPPECEDH